MALEPAIQNATHTGQEITWKRRDDSLLDLSGAAITGTITDALTGATRDIAGTLEVSDGPNGVFQWTYAAADVATPGTYSVQFTATFGLTEDSTFEASWIVKKKNVAA